MKFGFSIPVRYLSSRDHNTAKHPVKPFLVFKNTTRPCSLSYECICIFPELPRISQDTALHMKASFLRSYFGVMCRVLASYWTLENSNPGRPAIAIPIDLPILSKSFSNPSTNVQCSCPGEQEALQCIWIRHTSNPIQAYLCARRTSDRHPYKSGPALIFISPFKSSGK